MITAFTGVEYLAKRSLLNWCIVGGMSWGFAIDVGSAGMAVSVAVERLTAESMR